MTLRRIPCVYMRGGTSRGLVFKASDLPADREEWDAIFLAAMGVPDGYGRNLDGMGGGLSSLNKVCVVGPSSRADADVDYTFAQCAVAEARVDYAGNCGNMSAVIGPFAVEEGLVPCPAGGEAAVLIHNTNTGKVIVSRFPVEGGALAPSGDLEIDGVTGTAAPIRLEFLKPGGAKTGKLLPTGNALDLLGGVEASCIDAANPCVFVLAEALGKTGNEAPQELEADAQFLAQMEAIRRAGATAMGIPGSASVPLVAMVSRPPSSSEEGQRDLASLMPSRSGVVPATKRDAPHRATTPNPSSEEEGGKAAHILVRMISMGQPHRATPITGAICLAIACRVPGTLPHQLCGEVEGPIRIAHPSGTTLVDAALDAAGEVEFGAVYRTARRLFEGAVVYRGA